MTEQFGSEQTGDHAAAIDVANEITGGPWLPEYVNLARCYLELSSTAASTAAKVREMETRIAELERAVKARTSRMEGLPYTGPY